MPYSKFKLLFSSKKHVWYSPCTSTLGLDFNANQIYLTFQGFGFHGERLGIPHSNLTFCLGEKTILEKRESKLTFTLKFAQKLSVHDRNLLNCHLSIFSYCVLNSTYQTFYQEPN